MPSKTAVSGLRMQAHQHVDTGGSSAVHIELIKRLNAVLATEMILVLRYRRYHYMAQGVEAEDIADGFLLHSNEVLGHAAQIAQRIVQLGGEPDFVPDRFCHTSYEEYMPGESLQALTDEDQVAERIAMDDYREMIELLSDRDVATRQMLNEILAAKRKYMQGR